MKPVLRADGAVGVPCIRQAVVWANGLVVQIVFVSVVVHA
jgi:hypothetical protein